MATQSAPVPSPELVAKPAKKKLLRRFAPDHSQAIRRTVQAAFVVLNAVMGVEF